MDGENQEQSCKACSTQFAPLQRSLTTPINHGQSTYKIALVNRSKKKQKAALLRVSSGGQNKMVPESVVAAKVEAIRLQNPQVALNEYSKILRDNPQADSIRASFYNLLCDLELKQELLAATDEVLQKSPRDKVALSFKAHALRLSGKIEEAANTLEKLLKISPGDPTTLNSLASAVKELGDFERADELLQRALKIKPDYGKAHWNRSDISKTPEQDLQQINALLAGNRVPEANRHYLHFAAYRKEEKLGNHAAAFTHLELGNRLKRKTLNYALEADLKIDQGICELFDEAFLQSKAGIGFVDSRPIYIFGMPRSGTTLVEQIIASHTQVQGGNELSALGDATRSVQREYRLNGDFPFWTQELPETGWKKIGEHYEALVKDIRGNSPFLTDKALLNYKAAGLIRIALPNAKLIQVDRNPMDLCFGCYRQLFNEGLRYSYDFHELAKTYASYQKLMAHWDQVLPGFILRVKYEELVANPEEQIAAILDFCRLGHETACFEPHKTRRTVRTLSATQVREPISTKSIGRWKVYEQQLEPLRQALLTEGIRDLD